jgi:hypothetical protein
MRHVKKENHDTIGISGREEEKTVHTLLTQSVKTAEEYTPKKPILIRFDFHLLERVDTAAKRRGISRSAWIQFTLSRALDHGEG